MAIEDKFTLGPEDVSGGNPGQPTGSNPNFEDTQTYTEQELSDPNKIITNITDQHTPLVILFGASAGGKTVALIRLVRYLESQGLFVTPDPLFRPATDTRYKKMCDKFRDVVYDNNAALSTGIMNYMLVKVADSRRTICQIVEAPGEHYYNPINPLQQFPLYLNNIFHMPNRKVWVFLVEKNWPQNHEVKMHYAERIASMRVGHGEPMVRPHDRVVFMCTKVDKPESQVPYTKAGYPDIARLHRDIGGEFRITDGIGKNGTNLYTRYENTHPITRLWRPHNYTFIPFSAGTFNKAADGSSVFNAGSDYYPSMLWEAIR